MILSNSQANSQAKSQANSQTKSQANSQAKSQANSQALCAFFTLFLLLLTPILQSCSSSNSSTNSESTVVPFTTPTDASSLRAALVTDTRDDDNFEFWECALQAGNPLVSYRLLADDTGIETDLNNPAATSSFKWEVTSATTLFTTLHSTGAQTSFSDIRFDSRDNVSLVAGQDLNLECERKGTQVAAPTAPSDGEPLVNSLSYGGVIYPLTHGFEESFRFSPNQQGDTHSVSDFDVADAPFRSTTILNPTLVIWRPNNASVWFRARLHSPGGGGFESATFTFEPDSTDETGQSVSGKFFFQKGRFGVDIDGNGSIESETNEFIDISAGTVTVVRLTDGARMSFNVTLANGVDVIGSFEGVFPLFDNL